MAAQTHISSTTRIRGSVSGSDDLSVDGTIEGNVRLEGDLQVHADARIDGDVTAHSIVIHGTVKGDVSASAHLTISKSARLKGAVSAPILKLEDGALISGDLTIGTTAASGKTKSTKTSQRATKAPTANEVSTEEPELPAGVVGRKVKVKE